MPALRHAHRSFGAAVVALLVAAMAVISAPSGGAADADDTVAYFYDSAYVFEAGCAVAPPDDFCSGFALREWLLSLDVELREIAGITEGDFATALDGANVLVIPELAESNTLGADMSPAARQVVADFVGAGGRVVIAAGANVIRDPTPTINAIFGFSTAVVNTAACEPLACTESAAAAGTEFEGIGDFPYVLGNVGLDPASLPAGSIVPVDDPNNAVVPVTVMPYGDGAVGYVGWTFFQSEPSGPTNGGPWAEAMEAAITPVTVDIAPSASGPADGTEVECPVDVGRGSQPVSVSWEGSFDSDGEVFTGDFVLEPDTSSSIFGFTDNPAGDTARVTITVENAFGEVVNDTCVFTFTSTTTTTAPPTTRPVAQPAPIATATPRFTG
jgi:hypothetical protein